MINMLVYLRPFANFPTGTLLEETMLLSGWFRQRTHTINHLKYTNHQSMERRGDKECIVLTRTIQFSN